VREKQKNHEGIKNKIKIYKRKPEEKKNLQIIFFFFFVNFFKKETEKLNKFLIVVAEKN